MGAMRNKHLETIISAPLQMQVVSSGSGHCHINQKTVILIIRKSQLCVLHFRGIKHETCFFIKLNLLAPKDDNNHSGSIMLRKWNDQQSCWPLTCKGMDGTFKFCYFARYNVHLSPVQKG